MLATFQKLCNWLHKSPISLPAGNCSKLILTHRGRDKMATISQMTFSVAFSWMKIYKFWLKFHWSLFLGFKSTIFQHWFRSWLGADQVTSHYLNQWCLVYWCIYASLGLNELVDPLKLVGAEFIFWKTWIHMFMYVTSTLLGVNENGSCDSSACTSGMLLVLCMIVAFQ